jgi:dUTP pyrophosphatase
MSLQILFHLYRYYFIFTDMTLNIDIVLLSATAKIPAKGKDTDAGYDLCADESAVIKPGNLGCISTGISINIPQGWFGRIFPRSGNTIRHRSNTGAGVIDSGYTGDIKVALFNHGDKDLYIHVGDRIAQIVFLKCASAMFQMVTSHATTIRGTDGFGSTGN